jgi:aminoglycoside 6'-N-acetyltransferase I
MKRKSAMTIRLLKASERDEWARLRVALWPDCSTEQHEQEMAGILQNFDREPVFVSVAPDGRLQGFLEVNLRTSAWGCKSSPVGYLEGWYMEPDVRRQGIGGALVAAAEEWARSKGCQEMASDAEIDNRVSHISHGRLGYEEVERLVHFRKPL